jgi:PAB-dependent poly(A)-specific ribonuclease subunit 2
VGVNGVNGTNQRLTRLSRSPLNAIGLPYYDDPLLSNISPCAYATLSSPLLQPSPSIPKSVLSSVRVVDGVGYAPLPKELRGKRNVVCKSAANNLLFKIGGRDASTSKDSKRNGQRRESGPRFRSEKKLTDVETLHEDVSRWYRKIPGGNPRADRLQLQVINALSLTGDGKSNTMPKYYRRVEIKYSRFGVEDFDFE